MSEIDDKLALAFEFAKEWLESSPERATVNQEWSSEHLEDLAALMVEYRRAPMPGWEELAGLVKEWNELGPPIYHEGKIRLVDDIERTLKVKKLTGSILQAALRFVALNPAPRASDTAQ